MSVLACASMAAALAKTPKNVFSFQLPKNVRPDTVQVRYYLTGKFGGHLGWQAYENEGDIWVVTDHRRSPAASLKAVVFTPSCEPERLVVDDLRNSSREHPLQCRPAPVIALRGRFARPPEWQPLRVQVHVDYVAPWVNRFLGIAGENITIAVSDVPADAAGQFEVTLPVITEDGGASDDAFSFTLREATSGNVLGVLHPPQPLGSPHGLTAAPQYPDPVEFALTRNR